MCRDSLKYGLVVFKVDRGIVHSEYNVMRIYITKRSQVKVMRSKVKVVLSSYHSPFVSDTGAHNLGMVGHGKLKFAQHSVKQPEAQLFNHKIS